MLPAVHHSALPQLSTWLSMVKMVFQWDEDADLTNVAE